MKTVRIVIASAAAILLWWQLPLLIAMLTGRVNTPRAEAEAMLASIRTAIRMYESDTGVSPAFGLRHTDDSVDFGSRVVERLCPLLGIRIEPHSASTGYLAIPPESLCILGILDPWGRPYRISPVGMATDVPAVQEVGGIAVWSVGPDGVDQRGKGDDVVPRPLEKLGPP